MGSPRTSLGGLFGEAALLYAGRVHSARLIIDTAEGQRPAVLLKAAPRWLWFRLEPAPPTGSRLIWRLEAGARRGIVGQLAVIEVRPEADGPLISARIIELPDPDWERWRDWLSDQGEAQETATASTVDRPGRHTAPESAPALARHGRQAVREAMRASLGRRSPRTRLGAEPLPPPPPEPEGADSVTASRSGSWARARRALLEGPSEDRRRERVSELATAGPELLSRSASPPLARLRWPDAGALQRSWDQHLQGGGLFVPGAALGRFGDALLLELVLPGGEELRVQATVVAPMEAGTGLSLQWEEAQRRSLEEALG